jgi:hypothetical protein
MIVVSRARRSESCASRASRAPPLRSASPPRENKLLAVPRGISLPALRRHRVKSDVVLAAAMCSAGDLTGSRAVADAALADTEAYCLAPLRWALACLLSDIGSGSHSPADIAQVRDRSAQFVIRHGGHWMMR